MKNLPVRYRSQNPVHYEIDKATLTIGAILVTVLIMYLIMKSRTQETPLKAKQWQISYNSEGLMTGIQLIEVANVA